MHRATAAILAFLLALAGTLGLSPGTASAQSAGRGAAAEAAHAECCGGDCRCGAGCRCAADDEPASRGDDLPALPERTRGERAHLVALPLAAISAVALGDAVDLRARTPCSTEHPAPPSCRERLARIARWTT